MITRRNVRNSPRLAGSVVRYHTHPTIQRQTVADHSWHLMRIYYEIWGPLPPEITTHMIWHDAGEVQIGDVPYGAKASSGLLHSELNRLEKLAVESMGAVLPGLTNQQKHRIKLCDICDMWEFGMTERLMGNRYGEPVAADTMKTMEAMLQLDIPEDSAAVGKYVKKMMEMFDAHD